MLEINSPNQGFTTPSLKEYIQLLFKHKWMILVSLAVVITAGILFNRFSTPVYEAVATIIYEDSGINTVNLNPAKPVLTKSSIQNLIEQLKSRTVIEGLIQALPEKMVEQA